MSDSIYTLLEKIPRILSRDQLRKTKIQLLSSLALAPLELISVAALLPLITQMGSLEDHTWVTQRIENLTGEFSLPTLLLAIAVIFIIKNIAIGIINSRQAQFISDISTDLSVELFRATYGKSWQDYINTSTEDRIRKIKEVPSDFAHHVIHNLIKAAHDLIVSAVVIAFLTLADIKILFAILIIFLPVYLIYVFFKRTIVAEIDKSFRSLTPLTSAVLATGLESFAEAKLYGVQNYFIKKYAQLRKTSSDYLAKLKAAALVPPLFFELAGVLVILGLVFYVEQTDNRGRGIEFIGLTAIAVYKILPALNRILNGLVQIMAFRYTVDELALNRSETIVSTESTALNFKEKITLKNISLSYDVSTGPFELSDINLEIQKGDFVVITGPSGSGKTTLLNLLVGLLENYKGEIIIDNMPRSKSNLMKWQSLIGMVPQMPVILHDSIQNNIAFGRELDEIDTKRMEDAATKATLLEFISRLPNGFQTLLGENGLSISGGQRQRLALARALYTQPQVLFLDEPTNQLDAESKQELLRSLKACHNGGMTIILISHDLMALDYCTQHFKIFNGRLI